MHAKQLALIRIGYNSYLLMVFIRYTPYIIQVSELEQVPKITPQLGTWISQVM